MFELVEGRGISSGNEVFFIFNREINKVVMATYRDMPGVPLDKREPNIIKTFSKDEWIEINRFLSAGADEYLDKTNLFEDEFEGEGIVGKISESDKIEEVALPKVSSNSIPSMTNSEENGENSRQAGSKEATKVNGSASEGSENAP